MADAPVRASGIRNPGAFFARLDGRPAGPARARAVSVVAAIIPWNAPHQLMTAKGGIEGLHSYPESKTMIFEEAPAAAR